MGRGCGSAALIRASSRHTKAVYNVRSTLNFSRTLPICSLSAFAGWRSNMALLTWNSKYSVGVEAMDKQHTMLFTMINDLHAAMSKGQAQSITGALHRQAGEVRPRTLYGGRSDDGLHALPRPCQAPRPASRSDAESGRIRGPLCARRRRPERDNCSIFCATGSPTISRRSTTDTRPG